MSTDPTQAGDDGPELRSLEADETVPPRPEEDAADAFDHPHRHSEQRTHPDDVVGALSGLPEEGEPVRHSAGDDAGGGGTSTQTSFGSPYTPHDSGDVGAADSQPYPPSPAPGDPGLDNATADSTPLRYEPPDYPEGTYDGPAEG